MRSIHRCLSIRHKSTKGTKEIYRERVRLLNLILCSASCAFLWLTVVTVGYTFELNKRAQSGNHHSFFTLHPARQPWSIARSILPFQVIPDLAIRAVAVPTKIAIRDRVDR